MVPSVYLVQDKEQLTDTQYRKLSHHHSKLPHMYGLPKTHKTNAPLRPIVSCRGSACHPLSQFLAKSINPLSVETPTCQELSPLRLTASGYVTFAEHTMISLDVVSLFTKVPTMHRNAERSANKTGERRYTARKNDNPN